jgi:hypothetical protein
MRSQLVVMQAALHEKLALGPVDQLDGHSRCVVAVGNIDDLETADVDPC